MEREFSRRKKDIRDYVANAQKHHDYYVALAMFGGLDVKDLPQVMMAVLREKVDVVKPLGKSAPMLPEDLN